VLFAGRCAPLRLLGHRAAVAVTVWLNLFGGLLDDKSHQAGDLTVVSHNVDAGNRDPAGTARDLAASGADLLALEELTTGQGHVREGAGEGVPAPCVQGTVGLWSKLPLSGTRPVDVRRA